MIKRILAICIALSILVVPAVAVEDGMYWADIAVSDDWFGFTDAIAVVSDAGVTLRVTATTGEGEALVVGGEAIEPSVNARGEDVYTLPVGALDAPVTIAWRDAGGAERTLTLTVESDGLTPFGAAPASPQDGPDAEALEDGAYDVAEFSFSGGSGRVTISCDSLRVTGGQAVATIVFSSPHYGYVKAGGATYEGKYTDESSEFEIPVNLNADTVILGMTTAMSQPHEIEYTLRVVPGARREG